MKLITLSVAVVLGTLSAPADAFNPSLSSLSNRNFFATSKASRSPKTDCYYHVSTAFLRQNVVSQRHPSQLFMGWGPDPVWTSATVTSNSPACPSQSCVSITIDVSSDVMEAYAIPGQYVQMKASIEDEEAKPIFLAIASPPQGEEGSSNTMEFLIKKTDNNSWITSASESTTVAVSQVMGGGFPMEENLEGFKYDFPTQNILLFANGSGIAPIRAAIESGQLNVAGNSGRTCRLYYGIRSPSEMPYAEKFAKWEEAGVEVVPVISRPEDCKEEWPGRTGYVQNALEEDGVPIPRNSGALLCGVKGMAESVKDTLLKAGVFEGRVLTNF